MPDPAGGSTANAVSLRDYLLALRRRKWIIVQAVVLVPVAALLASLSQQKLYQASSEVLLTRQNLAASLTDTADPLASQDAERTAQTQAELARVPEVARRVLASLELEDRAVDDFLASSEVSTKQNTDLLVFRVTDPDPRLARRLATAYSRQFTRYRLQLDTASLIKARREVERWITRLEAADERDSPLFATLVEKEQQLRTMEALQTSNASVVRRATEAEQVQPRPVRNVLLGLGLGLLFGVGLAFLWEALDTRVRSHDEIGERLVLPMLARLPTPPRRLRKSGTLVTLARPDSFQAEAFRMLRTNLEFVCLDRNVRTIMVTSAVQEEGKSTTVANLAVTLARGGLRVILVDLDLRRPYLDHFFDLDGRPGVTDVALGAAPLEDALAPIAVTADGRAGVSGNGRTATRPGAQRPGGQTGGSLAVLPAGPAPPAPGEFVATRRVKDLLAQLGERADLVLVDAPPLLPVGDTMALSASVDGLVVVVRMAVATRPMLAELGRLLEASPAQKLGYVVTGSDADGAYGYGGGYYEEKQARRTKPRTLDQADRAR